MGVRASVLGAGILLIASGSAWADARVRPIWTDFQPAVSTQYRPPDGGKRYYPPNTRDLIRASDRQFEDDRPVRNQTTAPIPPANRAAPVAPPPSSLDAKPPSQVGR